MGRFTITTHFDVPIEKLFTANLDPYRIPEYMPWVTDIRDVHGKLDQVESGFRFTDHFLGLKVDATLEVVQVEFPRLYTTLTTYENGMHVRWTDRLVAVNGGTDVLTEVEYEIGTGLVQAVADRLFLEQLIERRVRHSFENSKQIAERELPEPITA